jgi:hypothetical protein
MAAYDSMGFSKAETSTTELCGGCKMWKREWVRVRKLRCRAPPLRLKCDHGPHTEELYLGTCEVIVVDVAVVDASRKRTVESPLKTSSSKNRRIIDYVEKYSNKFKSPENQFPSPSVLLMEAMELDPPPPRNGNLWTSKEGY